MELKVVIIGEADAGKTCIAARFVHGEMPQTSAPTIGASFLKKRCIMQDGGEVDLQIWDTAGQERFRAMAPMYYRHARIAVIVFDMSLSPLTSEELRKWQSEILSYASPNVVIAVAGSKGDLELSQDFDHAAIEELCASCGMSFFQTSAVSGEGVDALFHSTVWKALERGGREEQGKGTSSPVTLPLGVGDRRNERRSAASLACCS